MAHWLYVLPTTVLFLNIIANMESLSNYKISIYSVENFSVKCFPDSIGCFSTKQKKKKNKNESFIEKWE